MQSDAEKGFTDDERILTRLATGSFLKLWSWPNLFRDQGDRNGDGKEICDLTVIFNNSVILFSDKRIKFSLDKEPEVAWLRWARRAIKSSLSQVEGAERWLTKYPERVFVDKKCLNKLPIRLAENGSPNFHKILVCHGVEQELNKLNAEGSFALNTGIEGEGNWTRGVSIPFEIGKLGADGLVHVFSEDSMWLVLKEFDTAIDFINYLSEREKILKIEDLHISTESDIIQLYYESYDPVTNDRNILKTRELRAGQQEISKGGLEKLLNIPNYLATKERNTVSYFIDEWMDNTISHGMAGTSEYSSWTNLSEFEELVKKLADTSRFERWGLASAFLSFYHKAEPGQRGTRVMLHPHRQDTAYLFLLLPDIRPEDDDRSTYRKFRREMLIDYCQINYLRCGRKHWIGLACETIREGQAQISPVFFVEGQDMVACDFTEWNEEMEHSTVKLKEEYEAQGLIGQRKLHSSVVNEFVDTSGANLSFKPLKGSSRNQPCFCGSGIKTKKCCGKLTKISGH